MRDVFLYLFAVALTASIGAFLGSRAFCLTDASGVRLTTAFMWLATSAFMGTLFARVNDDKASASDVLKAAGLMLCLSAPIAILTGTTLAGEPARISLVLAILVMILVFEFSAFELFTKTPPLQDVFGIWLIATTILQIGRIPMFPYSRVLLDEFRSISVVLDIRLILTSITLALVFISGLMRATRRSRIIVADLRRLHLPPADASWSRLFASIVSPFVAIVDVAFQVVQVIANWIWRVIATTALFVVQVGDCVIEVIIETATKRLVRSVAITLSVWVLSLVMCFIAIWFASLVPQYVMTDSIFYSCVTVLRLGGLSLALAGSGMIIAWLVLEDAGMSSFHRVRDESTFVFTHFNVITLIASIVLLVLAQVRWLQIEVFRVPGLYTILLLSVMGAAVPLWFTRRSARMN